MNPEQVPVTQQPIIDASLTTKRVITLVEVTNGWVAQMAFDKKSTMAIANTSHELIEVITKFIS